MGPGVEKSKQGHSGTAHFLGGRCAAASTPINDFRALAEIYQDVENTSFLDVENTNSFSDLSNRNFNSNAHSERGSMFTALYRQMTVELQKTAFEGPRMPCSREKGAGGKHAACAAKRKDVPTANAVWSTPGKRKDSERGCENEKKGWYRATRARQQASEEGGKVMTGRSLSIFLLMFENCEY